jgi:hypothetical protein
MKIQVLFETPDPEPSFWHSYAVTIAVLTLSALVAEAGTVPALRFRRENEGQSISRAETQERRSPHGHHDEPDPNMLRMRHPVAASTSSLTLTTSILRCM